MNPRTTIGWLIMAVSASTAYGEKPTLAPAVNGFGDDMLARIVAASPNGNVVLSPASIHQAMAMVTLGAAGDTRAQLDRVLILQKFPDPGAPYKELLAKLPIGDVNQPPAATRPDADGNAPPARPLLFVTNRLWLANDIQILPAYTQALADDFHTQPTLLDFAHHTADALKAINDTVAKDTRDKIVNLIPAEAIKPDTRLVLTNAVYFKGDWQSQFEERDTSEQPFFTMTSQVKAPTMADLGHQYYGEDNQQQIINLPYVGREMSMVIVLPKKPGPFKPDWDMDLHSTRVMLSLPKFKFESAFSLGALLQTMGAPLAFSNQANFSGIATEPTKIGDVIHKALIDVNEAGTEAAAATAAVMTVGAARVEDEPVEMKVNHPFYFAIRHNPTGLLLFTGHVADPTK